MSEAMSPATAVETTEMPAREGIKETLESIVVALILAFVFRAFIVEAFVIPTGSMAPTLYGAHGTLLCEDCGIEFAYGLKDPNDTRRNVPVRATSRAVCPNCNHPNTALQSNDEQRNPEKGDRILVLKWPFSFGWDALEPARWDVIVFKDPADGTTNFIKRLVGLPNEVLMVADGDIYAAPTDELSPETLAELEKLQKEKYDHRSGIRRGRLRPVPHKVLAELDKKMSIRRKTDEAQRALWSPVYDHDHPPRSLDAYQPRWIASGGDASGWDASSPRIRFADQGDQPDELKLTGKEIRATCAYNIHSRPAPPVSDLRVRFVWTPAGTDAATLIRLEKLDRTFWARIAAGGNVSLLESPEPPTDTTPTMASARLAPFTRGQPAEVSFEIVDYRLALRIDAEVVVASSDDPAATAYYGPNLPALRRRRQVRAVTPRFFGESGAFEITHLVVERDEHYYHDARTRALGLPWAPQAGWASAESPILLRGHEFFMLGDNTAASKDSRLWDQVGPHLVERGDEFQLGTVPRDQLIGKAFFVYWPSGHRLDWLPIPGLKDVGIIPDVGRMRWIR